MTGSQGAGALFKLSIPPKPSEGNHLTPTETPTGSSLDVQDETVAQSVTASSLDTHDHDHDDHDHEGHDHEGHEHHHAPTLNPELTRSIEVDAPAEDVNKAFQQVTKRYTKLARIPGFRAGKVPPSLIKSRFAKEVRQEVLETLVSDRFRKALEEQNIRPVSQPQISELMLAEGAPLKFKATFEVLPDISVDGYDAVKVERPNAALEDGEYEAELANVLDHHATVEPVEEDRALTDGDWAEIGFKGQVQDVAQVVGEEGLEGKEQPQPITGEDVLIEIGGKNTLQAFNEALRGAKVGQELSFEASYPAEFGDARLQGKTVAYDVTVKAIKKKTFPERDDEFAKQLGPYADWNDFETKLRERLESRKKDALESQARDKMLEEFVAKYQFPVPETFVQQQIDARLERGLRALAQQGMSSDAMRQLDFERLRAAQRDQAVNEVKVSMILDAIAEREHVEVTDEDLERELLMLSLQSREPVEILRKRLAEDGSLGRIREQMRREKTGTELFERLAG
ncbi:MAG: trigger factor [Acidobacteriaceae bacterium]